MKKSLIGLLLGAAVCLLAACAARTAGTQQQALPQLRIGYSVYAPFTDHDEAGEARGLDVDLAEEACARMGYEPVFVQIDWTDGEELLEDGTLDCLWCGFAMSDHEDHYQWAGPYLRNRQVAIVKADSPIQTLDDLNGKVVATVTPGKSEELLLHPEDYPNVPDVAEVYAFRDSGETYAALRSGYCDAICGKAATWYTLLGDDVADYRFLEPELAEADLGVAFSKSYDPEVVQTLSRVLREMTADGTIQKEIEAYGLADSKALEVIP